MLHRRLAPKVQQVLASLGVCLAPLWAQAQLAPVEADPFSLSAAQLTQSTDSSIPIESDINQDFDAFGNRLVPLNVTSFVAPIDREVDFLAKNLSRDIGKESLVTYTPILPIGLNPYNLKPLVESLYRIGSFDIQKPAVSYSLDHSDNLAFSIGGEQSADFSNTFSTDFTIRSAPDRGSLLNLELMYRPTLVRFVKFTEFSSLNHNALLRMTLPLKRINLAAATTFVQSTEVLALVGGQSTRTGIGQSLVASYDRSTKTKFSLRGSYEVSDITPPAEATALGLGTTSSTGIAIQGDMSYRATDRISLSATLGYTSSEQSTDGAQSVLNNDLTSVNPGLGMAYQLSSKLQISLSGGMNFNQIGPATEFYGATATYVPTATWELSAAAGTTAILGDPALGISTQNEYFRVSARKAIYRNVTLDLGWENSLQGSPQESTVSAAIGEVQQTLMRAGLTMPLRGRTRIRLVWSDSTIESTGQLANPGTTTFSLSVRHQF